MYMYRFTNMYRHMYSLPSPNTNCALKLFFLHRKKGGRGEDVFLNMVNNCGVTMWVTLTRTENKKHTENCWRSRTHCRTQKLNSVLAPEITSTWPSQKSQNKTVINDIYWHFVNVSTICAPQPYMPQFIPPLAQHMESVLTLQWFDISGGSTEAVIGKLGICDSMIKRKIGRDGERRRGNENLNHIPDMSEGGPQGDGIMETWGSQRKKTQWLMAKNNKKMIFISVQVSVIMNIVCLHMIHEARLCQDVCVILNPQQANQWHTQLSANVSALQSTSFKPQITHTFVLLYL